MNNINDILQGLVPEQPPLVLPTEVPSDLELVDLSKRVIKAILIKDTLSSVDAPLLKALLPIVYTFQEE